MHDRTQMGSKTTTRPRGTAVSAARKCPSWIERFVEVTDNLEAPSLFRKWAAISTIASVLEQKVWIQTSSPIYPNLYAFLIGHPGTGKTRTIRAAAQYTHEIPDFHSAPVSFTWASLVDALIRSKRMLIRLPDSPLEYNSLTINADELGTFLHKYDKEMADGLSALYDPTPYGHERRGNDIRIKIKSPQLNIMCGSTPSNLMEVVPEGAWGQGLMSRVIMVFSDERIVGDDFANITRSIDPALNSDLKVINGISGEFKVTEDYRTAVNDWRALGEPVVPNHPKLIHYATRRRVHLYKLSMVAAIDRSGVLLLTKDDFNRALGWLLEAELTMPDIFKAGVGNADAKAMDEIYHYVLTNNQRNARGQSLGVPEHKVTNFARERVPIHSVLRVIEIMERSGMIESLGMDSRTGQRRFLACVPDVTTDGELA